jgi:uncharacterized protein YhjY with autotransporter beta-barrel domain
MNTKSSKVSASYRVFPGKFLVVVLTLYIVALPQQAAAATSNTQFFTYIFNVCNAVPPPTTTNRTGLTAMCIQTQQGGGAGGPPTVASVSANLGTINAGGGLSSHKKKVRVPSDDTSENTIKGASADEGGWGLLVTPQYSKSNRAETDLENGYQSNLTGLNVGLDYRFSDSFVFGGTIGHTQDKATFVNNAGSLKNSNNTLTLYSTWLPSDKVSVDGYLGYGKLNTNSQRQFVFGATAGIMNGNTSGSQMMAGLSTSYQKELGRYNLSPFLNLDFIKTSFKGYNESSTDANTNLMALHYGDRSTISFTSSLGARLGTSYGHEWGTLMPSLRLATVHEFQNNAQHLNNELVITPGTGFVVATDTPDRNYLLSGFGVAAALNGGTQLFFDFEKRSQDRLMSNWAVSLGALREF